MTCIISCGAKAYELVIRQQHQALLDASIALIEAANAISYYGPNPHQKGWQEDAQDAQDAAAKATSAAMNGVQPE